MRSQSSPLRPCVPFFPYLQQGSRLMLVAIHSSHGASRVNPSWTSYSGDLPSSPSSDAAGASFAEVRQPQQRQHHHQLMQTPLDSDSMLDTVNTGSTYSQTPPPLYTDVIHTILHFVSFADLFLLTRVSKQWRQSISTLKPRKHHSLHIVDQKWDADSRQRVEYSTSTLLPHVSHIVINIGESQSLSRHCERLSCFPCLTSVEGMFLKQRAMPQVAIAPSHLPVTLTSLQLHAVGVSTRLALTAISEVPSLRVLKLQLFQSQHAATLDFQPLLKLTQLRELTVQYALTSGNWFDSAEEPFDAEFELVTNPTSSSRPDSASLVDTVRHMPSLRRLDLGDSLRVQTLCALTQPLHQLQELEWISPGVDCDQEYVNKLPLLPSLTSIEVDGRFTDASFLLQLPKLTSLDLTFLDEDLSPWPHELVDCLQNLTQLVDLTLYYPFLEEQHLHQLFPCLPNLQRLALLRMEFEGLSWVRHLATQLVRLELWYCDQIDVTDYLELLALTRLESLKISESFDDNLAEAELSLFTLFSEQFPRLKEFSYQFGEIFVDVSPKGMCIVPPVYQ